MFTIFEEENEPLTERAKVDELLSKTQNTALAAVVAQLRYQLNTVGITFTVAATNHLNSEISQTPNYQLTRKISAIGSSPGRGAGRSGREDDRVVMEVVGGEAAEDVASRAEPLDTSLRRNRTSCLLKNVRDKIRKGDKKGEREDQREPSPRSSQPNNSQQQSLALSRELTPMRWREPRRPKLSGEFFWRTRKRQA